MGPLGCDTSYHKQCLRQAGSASPGSPKQPLRSLSADPAQTTVLSHAEIRLAAWFLDPRRCAALAHTPFLILCTCRPARTKLPTLLPYYVVVVLVPADRRGKKERKKKENGQAGMQACPVEIRRSICCWAASKFGPSPIVTPITLCTVLRTT